MAYSDGMPPVVDADRAAGYARLEPAQLAGLVVEAVGLEPDTPEGAQIATALATLVSHADQLRPTDDRAGQRTVDGLAALASRLIGSAEDVSVTTDDGRII